ncbi:putative F-box protein At4g05475 [Vicia villosa]|uniref:putative F-box protein At4g05475 n=1 Tax=Vicia villosa TaxID=3911 RepID=UPI00273B390A|nr:putative F-box protein At4g05475 [Vicia villosa]
MASYSIASCENTAVPNWLELPKDITTNILQRLDTIDIVTSVRYVCPLWWNIFKDPLMWRTTHITSVTHFPYYGQLVKICHYAIKQSCGQLEDISMEKFATDYLPKSIIIV